MKNLITAVALFFAFGVVSAQETHEKVVKVEKNNQQPKKKASKKQQTVSINAMNSGIKMTKEGKIDRRTKEGRRYKKDGTLDMRRKENRR